MVNTGHRTRLSTGSTPKSPSSRAEHGGGGGDRGSAGATGGAAGATAVPQHRQYFSLSQVRGGSTSTATAAAATATAGNPQAAPLASAAAAGGRGGGRGGTKATGGGHGGAGRITLVASHPIASSSASSSASSAHQGGASGASVQIRTPHPHDVLCGRGGGINSHPGNKTFRQWVQTRKEHYNLAPSKADKARVSREVVDLVRALNPPGRFLTREGTVKGYTSLTLSNVGGADGGWWVEIDDAKAMAKTSQALREGAPGIRAAHKEQLGLGGEASSGEARAGGKDAKKASRAKSVKEEAAEGGAAAAAAGGGSGGAKKKRSGGKGGKKRRMPTPDQDGKRPKSGGGGGKRRRVFPKVKKAPVPNPIQADEGKEEDSEEKDASGHSGSVHTEAILDRVSHGILVGRPDGHGKQLIIPTPESSGSDGVVLPPPPPLVAALPTGPSNIASLQMGGQMTNEKGTAAAVGGGPMTSHVHPAAPPHRTDSEESRLRQERADALQAAEAEAQLSHVLSLERNVMMGGGGGHTPPPPTPPSADRSFQPGGPGGYHSSGLTPIGHGHATPTPTLMPISPMLSPGFGTPGGLPLTPGVLGDPNFSLMFGGGNGNGNGKVPATAPSAAAHAPPSSNNGSRSGSGSGSLNRAHSLALSDLNSTGFDGQEEFRDPFADEVEEHHRQQQQGQVQHHHHHLGAAVHGRGGGGPASSSGLNALPAPPLAGPGGYYALPPSPVRGKAKAKEEEKSKGDNANENQGMPAPPPPQQQQQQQQQRQQKFHQQQQEQLQQQQQQQVMGRQPSHPIGPGRTASSMSMSSRSVPTIKQTASSGANESSSSRSPALNAAAAAVDFRQSENNANGGGAFSSSCCTNAVVAVGNRCRVLPSSPSSSFEPRDDGAGGGNVEERAADEDEGARAHGDGEAEKEEEAEEETSMPPSFCLCGTGRECICSDLADHLLHRGDGMEEWSLIPGFC